MRWTLRTSVVSLIVALAAQIAWAGGHSTGGGTVHVRAYYSCGLHFWISSIFSESFLKAARSCS
jgi:hypothetical protein